MSSVISSTRKPMPRQLFGFFLMPLIAATSLACAGAEPKEPELDPSKVILHLDYRSGGDAPVSFLLTFFDDRSVRYYTPRRKILWERLDAETWTELKWLIGSSEFHGALEQLRASSRPFACCDQQEVGIFLGAAATPVALDFDQERSAPEPIEALIVLVNTIARECFGHRYGDGLPES